jgi:ATP adenylyltransferase
MSYRKLADFVGRRMRMSHIYQPVMLLTLMRKRGRATTTEIAKSILLHDHSQIEYYENIVHNMVGQVLRRHGIVSREGDHYLLVDFEKLTPPQVQELAQMCRKRLAEYLDRRGARVWEHRRGAAGYISGTLRYEVLKRAKFHCDLCGIPADEKALEIDHILPRNHGGTDEPSNLQALCYSCNSMKRDRDDTDLRIVRDSYAHREIDCPFCDIPQSRIIAENRLAYVIRDAYPVTNNHTLIIPKRHIDSYFGLGSAELNACNELLRDQEIQIRASDQLVQGFNIGVNSGEVAGQTIFHCHIHLIPRRSGDVANPRGGIRHVILKGGSNVR